ncbi:MAG: hypothetical protein ACXVJP_17245 [Mucilaginibacter sp.]
MLFVIDTSQVLIAHTKRMKKYVLGLFCCIAVIILASSCSKNSTVKPGTSSPVTLGLYEFGTDSGKRIFMPVTQIGTQSVTYFSVFDTGSAGMTVDAHGIIPASMITSTGIQVTGDSVVVNGITITSKTAAISYGNKTGLTKEYGNLAYASITIGDGNGNSSAKRVPIFLYYKVVDGTGKTLTVDHSLDVFGVGPGLSSASSAIASPLTYFNNNSNLTSGFKLATLPTSGFNSSGTFMAGLLTIGLTQSDLTSSGFIMHPLAYSPTSGYSANIPATITYSGQTVAAQILFDTGTPLISIIENKLATTSTGNLGAGVKVTITTDQGFTYTYTTTSVSNLTAVENPNVTGDFRSILGIDFFINNEYLTDYTNHKIGLKNN